MEDDVGVKVQAVPAGRLLMGVISTHRKQMLDQQYIHPSSPQAHTPQPIDCRFVFGVSFTRSRVAKDANILILETYTHRNQYNAQDVPHNSISPTWYTNEHTPSINDIPNTSIHPNYCSVEYGIIIRLRFAIFSGLDKSLRH